MRTRPIPTAGSSVGGSLPIRRETFLNPVRQQEVSDVLLFLNHRAIQWRVSHLVARIDGLLVSFQNRFDVRDLTEFGGNVKRVWRVLPGRRLCG